MNQKDTLKKFNITVDVHEKPSGLGVHLEHAPSLSVMYAELPVGDIIIADNVCIERKEATDFVQSILDRRLFSQIAQMKASYERSYIIIEGDPFSTYSAISPDAIRGALSWMTVIEGIPLVQTEDVRDTADWIIVMTRHAQEGLGYDIPLRCAKPKDLSWISQFIVEGLPSVGATGAKKLLHHFGSVAKVMSATQAELEKVDGIGKKTAERIREAIDFQIR